MLVIMGISGAGKSVQGKLLAEFLGWQWVSTGELIRAQDSKLHEQAVLSGELVGDEQIIPLIQDKLEAGQGSSDYILDGFPRSQSQTDWLIEKYRQGDVAIQGVINLVTSQETAKQRLLARARPDDHELAISRRFKEYIEKISPLINELKLAGIPVFEINSERSTEEVQTDLRKITKNFQNGTE